MADIIHNLSVGGTSRPLGTVHYIEGTSTTAGTWLGSDPSISAYYDGLTIAYKVNIAGASTTTLNINSLGAKTVRRNASNLTTQYPVNSVVHLTYTTIDGTSYWQCADYDTDADKKTTSGNTSSKIFLVGALSQSTSGQTTYSHDTAYVGTDGCLYSGGNKVLTSYTDTKNTAGSTNTSSKIYLVGATSQAANPQTYSHDTAYVGTDGYLYSGGLKVDPSAPAPSISVPRVTKSILTIACEQAVNTQTVWFNGSDATSTVELPCTYCISEIKKGDNHRTLIDAYSLTDGKHYVNYNKSATTVPENLEAWSGWKLQPNETHKHTVTHTPAGSVKFTGSTATTSASSNSTVASSTHTHTVTSTGSYTPEGSVAAPTFTGSAATSGGPSATTSVASSAHTHTVSASIANNCMTISSTSGTPSATATVPTYNHTHSVTAKGSNSAPAFTGTAATISVSGTTATPSATTNVAKASHTHTVTANGSASFTGTTATITTSASTN